MGFFGSSQLPQRIPDWKLSSQGKVAMNLLENVTDVSKNVPTILLSFH